MKKTLIAAALSIAACGYPDTASIQEDVSWEGGCTPGANDYTPYTDPANATSGTAASLTWPGEDFEEYSPPVTVECEDNKSAQSKLDVTSACLGSVLRGSMNQYKRGQVQDRSGMPGTGDIFRTVALGRATPTSQPYAWTDQHVKLRFYYDAATNTINEPGFKLFTRYQTENTLYVAGLWADGRAMIKKKVCGTYTTLATVTFTFPAASAWYWIEFDAVGSSLTLKGGTSAPLSTITSATDSTLTWGTSGYRVDSYDGSLLDDWTVN